METETGVQSVVGEGETTVTTDVVITNGTEETTTVADETKIKRVRIGQEDFLVAWEETVQGLKNGELKGSGIKIVADRLGLKETTVQQRSTKYRSEYGLPLSKMPRGGATKFNTSKASETLAAIKARLNPEKPPEGETAEKTYGGETGEQTEGVTVG